MNKTFLHDSVRPSRTDIEGTSGTWLRQMPVTLLLAMVGTLVACDKTPTSLAHSERSDAQRLHAQIPYPRIDTFLGEQLHDDEEQVAQKIALLMEQAVQETPRKYGTAIRDAHPKAHGCVQAQFHVDRSLPAGIATGVFQPGHTYEAWIRFSNSNADPSQADITGDGRGMAVKLMEVPGEKILKIEREATTQDFVMISHPVFIIDDPTDYLAF